MRDSAAGAEKNSRVELNYRETTVLSGPSISNVPAYYPRVKVLADGSYLLFFHNTRYGADIYCMQSKDGLKWKGLKTLFTMTPIAVNGKPDRRKYMTADACVRKNGEIIVVSSYRADKNYQQAIGHNGLAIRRSVDHGATWGTEQTVYVGTNWEPYIMEADNGELFIFFSSSAPSLYANGPEKFDERSSGVAMIRSKDGGRTWTPNVTGPPYRAQYVMRQYTGTYPDGIKRYTDQMPCAIQLNNGTMALAAESCLAPKNYKFSICYSGDYWAQDLGADAAGPANRKSDLFNLAGPYLAQFPSGETVLSYHWAKTLRYRLGNGTSTEFYPEATLFTGTGDWGSVTVDSSHSAMASIGLEHYGIKLGRLYLNHALNARPLTPVLDGQGGEWTNHTDALFVGSESQAQATVRVAYNQDKIYFLVERLDYDLTEGDGVNLFIDDGTKNFLVLKLNLESTAQASYYSAADSTYQPKDLAAIGVSVRAYLDGTKNNHADRDVGVAYEIAVPRTLLHGAQRQMKILATLQNADAANTVQDEITGTSPLDKSTWFTVDFK